MARPRFLGDLWRSARRPAVFRRCCTVAVAAGTLLSAVNQGDAILGGRLDAVPGLRILANYFIPFAVANLGAMSSLPPQAR